MTLSFAETAGVAERSVWIAVSGCYTLFLYEFEALVDGLEGDLIAGIGLKLCAFEYLLCGEDEASLFVPADSVRHDLSQLFSPGIAGTYAFGAQLEVRILQVLWLDSDVED